MQSIANKTNYREKKTIFGTIRLPWQKALTLNGGVLFFISKLPTCRLPYNYYKLLYFIYNNLDIRKVTDSIDCEYGVISANNLQFITISEFLGKYVGLTASGITQEYSKICMSRV